MFWKRNKEINKVLDKYGAAKGSALLTYFYSFVVESRKLFDYGRSSSELVPALTIAILSNHNQTFFAEYGSFFAENHANKKLIEELDGSNNKYYDETIFAEKTMEQVQTERTECEKPAQVKHPIDYLNSKADEIIQMHELSDKNGSNSVISQLNHPDSFSKRVMEYCKSHYQSDGEKKVRSEYVITSFYAAICATLLFKKKELKKVNEEYLFYQLMNFFNMEIVDSSAEHLLGTENGQPFAEHVWSIILPYVGACLEVLNSAPILEDNIISTAIKNSFTIGLLVGDKYSSGQYRGVLDLFVKEDIYKTDNPNDLDDGNKYGAVCISGSLNSGYDAIILRLSDRRAGSAAVKVFPINKAEQEKMLYYACNRDTVAVYGKLVNKGRWDSELHYAFIDYSEQYAKQLKRNL